MHSTTSHFFRQTGLTVALILLSLDISAETHDCESGGITLAFSADTATLTLHSSSSQEREQITLSPVFSAAGLLSYGETRPGTDDERIITNRMLRFDTSNGHLIYLENLNGTPRLFNTRCVRRASSTPQ